MWHELQPGRKDHSVSVYRTCRDPLPKKESMNIYVSFHNITYTNKEKKNEIVYVQQTVARKKLSSFLALTYITFRAVVYHFWAIIAGIRHYAQLMSPYQYITYY